MRDACVSFGQTDKVFAVAQVLGVYGDPILVCAQQQKLPFLANDGAASSYYAQSRNYVITTQPSTLRTNLNMARELIRLGETKGKKVGVVYYDGYLLADNRKLLAELRRNRVDVVEGQLSLETAQALRQLPVIARDFCEKRVDLVLLGTNKLFAERFVENVERTPGCRPRTPSRLRLRDGGRQLHQRMPASFFQRALSVTASRVGEGRVGIAEQPAAARCRTIAEKRPARSSTATPRPPPTTSTSRRSAACCRCCATGWCAPAPTHARELRARGAGPAARSRTPATARRRSAPGRTDSTDAVPGLAGVRRLQCWKPQTAFAPPPSADGALRPRPGRLGRHPRHRAAHRPDVRRAGRRAWSSSSGRRAW
jgi:hypothetical protein